MDQSHVTGVFAPDEVIKNALETLLGCILLILAGKHGGKGPKLTWFALPFIMLHPNSHA